MGRATVELTSDLCDGVWDIDAYYPAEPGENLPFTQTLFEYNAQGQLPLRYALEKGLGIENPEDLMLEILVEQILKSPPGQSMLLSYAAQDSQDKALATLEQEIANGNATRDGTPTAAMAGVGQQAPHMTGMGAGGNPVRQALAGIVGGAMETRARNNDAVAAAPVAR